MSDLHVVATFKAKPDSADELAAVLASLVAPTRQEAGCISYVLERGVDDPTLFFTVESWRADADMASHMATPHVKAALLKAPDLLAAGTEAAA